MPKKKKDERRYFCDTSRDVKLPDLIRTQKDSYDWFLREGLGELFQEITPVEDFTGADFELQFEDYYFDDAKFDEVTSRDKKITYEAALRVRAILVNKKTKEKKKQEVYLGDFPLMTDRGTFIINGVERVVVTQLIRSSGILFTSQFLKGRRRTGAKVIPNRGAWLEFETDPNNVLWVKIDRKRKIAVSAFLRALGF
ncbi:MAG: DNA-directed RNA polymerase subunit beta, partial [Nitrospinota bacterium]|nr:DNA-directed RNA polymerase subunit beta [Nitrospinota bacterium]